MVPELILHIQCSAVIPNHVFLQPVLSTQLCGTAGYSFQDTVVAVVFIFQTLFYFPKSSMVDFLYCNSVSCTVIFSSTLLITLSCCHLYRKNTCLLFSNTQVPNFSEEYFLIQINCITKQSVGKQYSK